MTHTSALLVLVFTLCWLPSYGLMFSLLGATFLFRFFLFINLLNCLFNCCNTVDWIKLLSPSLSLTGVNISGVSSYRSIAIFIRLLASSAAVVNPVLYVFMSNKFSRDLMELGRECWEGCRGVYRCGGGQGHGAAFQHCRARYFITNPTRILRVTNYGPSMDI